MNIYIAGSSLILGHFKVGVSIDPFNRAKELYGDWNIKYSREVKDAFKVETVIKDRLKDFRIKGTEIFNCPLEYVKKVIDSYLDEIPIVQLPKEATVFLMTSKSIGALIRQVRKESGLTQKELAGHCNLGTRFIVDIEKGKKICELEKVLEVMRMLGIKVYIIGGQHE